MSYVDFVLYKSNVCGLDHSVFSNLDPVLSEDDVQDLVKTSLSSVVTCQPDDEEHNLVLMEKTLMALSDLLKELLMKNMTVKTLNVLLQVRITTNCFMYSVVDR